MWPHGSDPLVKFHLSEFRIWKELLPWGNRGNVACWLLRMKTTATYFQPLNQWSPST